MNQHTVTRFEGELNELREKVLEMGGLVEKAVRRSMKALIKHDTRRAHKVIERDHAINALEIEIDEMTRNILALRQPAASDLRFVMTTIKIVTDLERMGDLAESIAEEMLYTQDHPLIHIHSIQTLATEVIGQLKLALDAFADYDTAPALGCIEREKRVVKLFEAMQREHLTYMLEDSRQITAELIATNILADLERIGAHAVNIAEMLIYMISGKDIRHMESDQIVELVGGSGGSAGGAGSSGG